MVRGPDTERDLEQIRQRCEERLRDLDLPSPFDVHRFCARLAARRGREIRLCPLPLEGGPSGLWIARPDADFIFYQEHTTPLHQAQITLHEACHIVCDHRPIELSQAEVADLLFPDLREEIVRRALERASYSTEEEREAEILASVILERAADRGSRPEKPLDSETAAVLEKHRLALEKPMGSRP